jgi:glycosyltransferase
MTLSFKIASDTEFLLRYLYKHKIKMFYLNAYVVKMRMEGNQLKKSFEVLKEITEYITHKPPALEPSSLKIKKAQSF